VQELELIQGPATLNACRALGCEAVRVCCKESRDHSGGLAAVAKHCCMLTLLLHEMQLHPQVQWLVLLHGRCCCCGITAAAAEAAAKAAVKVITVCRALPVYPEAL